MQIINIMLIFVFIFLIFIYNCIHVVVCVLWFYYLLFFKCLFSLFITVLVQLLPTLEMFLHLKNILLYLN